MKLRLDGVSQRMLATTLKALERDGLLLRRSDGSSHHRLGYALTPLGVSIVLAIEGFISFAMAQLSSIEASRRSYDRTKAHGRRE